MYWLIRSKVAYVIRGLPAVDLFIPLLDRRAVIQQQSSAERVQMVVVGMPRQAKPTDRVTSLAIPKKGSTPESVGAKLSELVI